jgi:hypothetical protein
MENLTIAKSKEKFNLAEVDKNEETFMLEYTTSKGKLHVLTGCFDYDFDEEMPEEETGFSGSVDYDVTIGELRLRDENGVERKIESPYLEVMIEEMITTALEDNHEFEYAY